MLIHWKSASESSTNGVDGESWSVRNGGVFAKEDDFVDGLTGSFLPAAVQVIFFHYAFSVYNHPHSTISEALHLLKE